ncbi:hypothetical protein C1924_10110 [Stenotrophomonas sp. ESTM1D_MKCIP4_1]|uniref:hypothetical protein n=1 Tax=Stenotrophomonas sp. ESTM1D_MKCIP4_1 TaxID=2072414 RepID=UPI000D53D8A9|nr:hypothetical protein [Stenotrophomonas sp. ESTM1D_MKCIP4_1]AWH53507.1 hypothetical protein C1924_10110 [Stenotrophomonas sp. ESTM1D_MKCIP4_1]
MTHPIATAADWKNAPLPARHVALKLDFWLDAVDSACVRRGLIPLEMEDKWFLYCAGNTLYLHRSWTGLCIARVHFVPDGEGLRAVSAEVNRDPEQYAGTDDAADVALIEGMVRGLGASQQYRAARLAREHGWLTITPPE